MTAFSAKTITWVRAQIITTQDFIYLNSGYTGPNPRSTALSVRAWIRRWYEKGLTTPPAVLEESQATEDIRQKLAVLLNCSTDEVALTSNTSHGISIIASGIDWQPGDEIVTNDLEHPSGLLPWFLLRERWGVEVKTVKFPPGADPLERLAEALTPRTRLVCVSNVMYCTGLLLPIADVARLVHERGALCLVDGAQAAGNLPLDMAAMGCDFYALPGQKWLLGPPGTGALYVRRDVQDRVWPSSMGWNSVDSFEMDGCFTLRNSARRYEAATQPYSLLAGWSASLSFVDDLGRAAVYDRIRGLVACLRGRLQDTPGVKLTPSGCWGPSALVCFNLEGWEPQELVDRLLQDWRIVCRSIATPPAVRVCPHFFNTEEEIETLIEALSALSVERH